MMTSILKIGLIGAGRIGQVHAESIATRIINAEVIAIADIRREIAERTAGRLNIPQVSDNYQDLLNNPSVDAVAICSSTDTHAQIIREAAAAGKHIFCEKPIDHSLRKIDAALAAVEKAGVKFQVGFNRRFVLFQL